LQNRVAKSFPLILISVSLFSSQKIKAQSDQPKSMIISSGWQLQDVAKVPQSGEKISNPSYNPESWYAATVPGTVLTSLVNDKVYPDPTYGENNRPEIIPESLSHTSYL